MTKAASITLVALALFASVVNAEPAPEDIVTVVVPRVPEGDETIAIELEGDRWFILTDVIPVGIGEAKGTLALIQRENDRSTSKLSIKGPFHSATGIAFKPGSRVVIKDRGWVTVTLIGYMKEAKKP